MKLPKKRKPRIPPPQQFDQAAMWAERIGRQWGKTVADVINTGRLLLKAKDELNHGEWGYMFVADAVPKPLPFGQDYAAMLMRIAKNPILANSANRRNLPSSVSALYELAQLPHDVLAAALQQGRVTPEMRAKQAAKLGHPDARPEPEWWTESALLVRTRAFASKELRRLPADEMAPLVGHALRAVAHEILTPLPDEQHERLCRDLDRLKGDDRVPDLRAEFEQYIRDSGGIRPTHDHPGLPFRFLNHAGRPYDVVVEDFATSRGMGPREVERQLESLDQARPPSAILRPDRRAATRQMKALEAILDGRALKTGLVPIYYLGPPLAPQVAEEIRRRAREIRASDNGEDRLPDPDHVVSER